MATPAPEGLDVTELKFKLQSKVPIFKGDGNVQNGCNLLATASVHGLIFAGTTDRSLRVLQLKDITRDRVIDETVPLRTIQLPSEPFQLAVSCDNSLLAVDVSVNGVSFIFIYAVASFLTPSIVKLQEIRTSPEANVRSTQILWNPVLHNIFSLRAENGALSVYTLKEQSGLEFHSLDKNEGAMCACWSPKGKQLVVGFANGKLVQYKPDLKPARTIPCPSGLLGGNFDVIALQWLSTYQFAAVFMPHAEDSVPALFIINAPKAGNPVFINYDDICYSQSGPRKGQIFLQHIVPWNLLLMASANSMEAGILGTTESGETPTWYQWTTTDEARAELPLTSNKQESFPVGLVLETGCSHEVTLGEQTLPVMPMIHLLSTYGLLVSFNVLNLTPNIPSLCSPPKPMTDTSGKFEKIDFNSHARSIAAPAPPQSAEISFAVAVGATSTPAIAKTKSFFSPSENKSPMSLFGGNAGASVAGTNSTAITPSFGKQITFGGTPSTTAVDAPKTVAFGNNSMNQVPTPPQTPQSQLKTQSVKTAELAKPLVTVPSTYTPPPVSEVVRSSSVGSVSQQTQKTIQKKTEPSDDTNIVIRSMITEEIKKFQKELLDLQNRCKSLSIDVGSKEDSAKIIKNLKELQDLSIQAAESTESLTSDVQALRLGLNEAFAMVAEANSKHSIYKHPSPNQFQETHAMSQSSRRQLANLQNILAVNENQLQIVNKQIDAQWSAIQQANKLNSKRRMHVPSLEVLYLTLTKQQEILNRQREKLGFIKGKLGMRESIRGLETGKKKELPSVNESAIDSLTDSIISMTLADKVREDACRINEAKMCSLRNMLRNRKIVVIKPGRPDRIGLNSEVVRERRNEVRRLHLEKEKVMTAAASPVTFAVPKKMEEKSKPQQMATVPVKATSVEPIKSFELPKAAAVPSFATKTVTATAVSTPVQPTTAAQLTTTTVSFSFTPSPAVVNSNIKNPVIFGSTMATNANTNTAAAYSFGPIFQPSNQPVKPKEPPSMKEVTIFENTTIKPVSAVSSTDTKDKENQEPPSKPTIPFGFNSSSVQTTTKADIFNSAVDFSKPSSIFGSNTTSKPSSVFSFGGNSTGPVSFGALQPTASVAQIPVSTADVGKEKQSEPKNEKPKKITNQDVPTSASKNDDAVKASFPGITSLLQKDEERNKTEQPKTTTPVIFGSVTKTTTQVTSSAANMPSTGVFGKNTTTSASFTGAVPGSSFNSLSFGGVTSAVNPSTQSTATTVSAISATSTGVTSSNLFGSIQQSAAVSSSNIGFPFGSPGTDSKPTDLSKKPDAQKNQTSVVFGTTAPTSTISTTSTAATTVTTTTVAAAVITSAAPTTTSSISFGFATTSAVSSTTPISSTPPATTTPVPNPASTTDAAANLFGSFNICTPQSTPASTSASIFGSTSFAVPKTTVASIFGGNASVASTFGTDATKPSPIFASTPVASSASTPGTGMFGSVNSSPFAGANTAPSSNVFGSVAGSSAQPTASTGSIFGGAANNAPSLFGTTGSATPTTAAPNAFAGNTGGGSIFGTMGSSSSGAAAGGSIFGGTSSFGTSSNIFASPGGFGTSTFGQPSTPQSAQSIFGGTANTTGFGNTSFGSPAPAGGSFSQSTEGSVAQSGFGSPTSSAFNKPTFGGAPAFGGAPTFGATPTFGGAPSFGSPPAFGAKPTFGATGGFGQAQISSPTQSNNLFEQLGSSSTGVSFGNLAQQPTQKPPQFGGSSFSSWRS